MKTKLKIYARHNYPVEFIEDRMTLMRRLQRRCIGGEINAVKEGRLWLVINDGHTEDQQNHNPLVA